MNKILPICILLLSVLGCSPSNLEKPPKLLIGIVVDQMRYDYLTRYWDDFSPNGFIRFYKDGFVAHNHHFNYYQTLTGHEFVKKAYQEAIKKKYRFYSYGDAMLIL